MPPEEGKQLYWVSKEQLETIGKLDKLKWAVKAYLRDADPNDSTEVYETLKAMNEALKDLGW